MIKPIETTYQGYKFRSRLEARWAVFYDALGIRWEYEREGFDLDGIWYLPDFYLPTHNYWIEIKPDEPSLESNEWRKIARLAAALNHEVFIAIGEVWKPYPYGLGDEIKNYHRPIRPNGTPASHSWWYECLKCARLSLSVFGHGSSYPCDHNPINFEIQFSNTEKLRNAYLAARQFRF